MIVRTETVNGHQIQIHENKSGRRRYWVTVKLGCPRALTG